MPKRAKNPNFTRIPGLNALKKTRGGKFWQKNLYFLKLQNFSYKKLLNQNLEILTLSWSKLDLKKFYQSQTAKNSNCCSSNVDSNFEKNFGQKIFLLKLLLCTKFRVHNLKIEDMVRSQR